MADDKTGEAERRKHVECAIADSRLEGYPPPSGIDKEILDAYIRGEIKAEDLIETMKRCLLQHVPLQEVLSAMRPEPR